MRRKLAGLGLCLWLLPCLLLALPWNAVKAQDSWDAELQSMLNRKTVLVQQVQEKQRLWLEHPSLDNELQYISMRNKLEHFSQTVANAAKSIKEARDANAVIWQTYAKTTDDLAKMLSTVFWAIVPDTTWLLGASDEDLYGPNWRWAEEKFKGIQAEARKIREEIQKLKDDPANAEKVAQLKARAQQVKQKMDTLRKVYRAEQQTLGTANIFWGDTMGRGIEACMESFKFSDLLGQFLDANVKYIFDVIKPMVLQQFGYKYVAAASRPSNILVGGAAGANDPYKDGMTMNMADELTAAILGADGDISEFKKALDIGMGKVVKDVMVKEFLSKELQKDLGKIMEEQLLQWSLNAPFDRIPTDFTSQTLNTVIADQGFKSDLTRKFQETWIPNAKEGLNKKMEIFAEDRLDHIMAWGPDIIDLWCTRRQAGGKLAQGLPDQSGVQGDRPRGISGRARCLCQRRGQLRKYQVEQLRHGPGHSRKGQGTRQTQNRPGAARQNRGQSGASR